MKKIILSAAIMLASVGAYAQHAVGSINLQPKIGVNIANVTETKDTDPRVGLAAGLEAEYQVSDIFSLSAGAIYSMQGTKRDWENAGAKYTATTKLDYINVPILANVYVTKGLAVKTSSEPDVKSVDFSIPVGISYEYANFQLDARYNWGLTKIYKHGDDKNSVFQITLGYKFDL
jgi:hypothetical protein